MPPCESCPSSDRELWGCGWDKATRGRAQIVASEDSTWRSCPTCPHWILRQPRIQSLYELLPRYRKGSLPDTLSDVVYKELEALDRAHEAHDNSLSEMR